MQLKLKHIQIKNEGTPVCIIHENTLLGMGISITDQLLCKLKHHDIVFQIVSSTDLVEEGVIAVSSELINRKDGENIELDINAAPRSLESIKNKIKGEPLSYTEAVTIMEEIATDKLDDIGKTYFASLGYNPGFNEDEIYALTQAMAQTGEMLKFNGIVCDKHSIGGVAGKGITPIVVSIVSSEGLTVPNTTTRAITTPAGTTDILESIMQVKFSKEEIIDIVEDIGACMVWGGGLSLAPADDRLIRVERYLNFESYDKFLISIMAKKLAMGIKNLVLDLPVGNHTKIHNDSDISIVKGKFEDLAKKLEINIYVQERRPSGIDGNAVGPLLEAREFMRVLEQHEKRSLSLEEDALLLAGKLFEISGKYPEGKGYLHAKDALISRRALSKFKEILQRQNGDEHLVSDEIVLSDVFMDYKSPTDGTVTVINNEVLVAITKILGCPANKKAGIYFFENVGNHVSKGDVLFRMYTTTQERLHTVPRALLLNLMEIVQWA